MIRKTSGETNIYSYRMKTLQEIKDYYYSKCISARWERQREKEKEKQLEKFKAEKKNLICDDCKSLFAECTCPIFTESGENHKTEKPIDYDYVDDDFPREKIVLNFGYLNRG